MDGIFSPSHILILLVVVLVLFGAKRLPGAAQSLGQSMHIFRRSVKGLEDEPPAGGTFQAQAITPQAAAPIAPAADGTQQQIADLQRQLDDLQQHTAENGAAVTDTPAQPKQ